MSSDTKIIPMNTGLSVHKAAKMRPTHNDVHRQGGAEGTIVITKV